MTNIRYGFYLIRTAVVTHWEDRQRGRDKGRECFLQPYPTHASIHVKSEDLWCNHMISPDFTILPVSCGEHLLYTFVMATCIAHSASYLYLVPPKFMIMPWNISYIFTTLLSRVRGICCTLIWFLAGYLCVQHKERGRVLDRFSTWFIRWADKPLADKPLIHICATIQTQEIQKLSYTKCKERNNIRLKSKQYDFGSKKAN